MSASNARDMEHELAALPGIHGSIAQFDARPHLLNFRNGTVDLRTGKLRPHDKNDMITHVIEDDYVPGARSERWEKFLQEIFPGDDNDLADYVQALFGYAVTGETEPHVFPVLSGRGRNGKSVLVDTIWDVLGHGYAARVSSAAMSSDSGMQALREAGALRGARLAYVSETGTDARINEETVKRWTGDTVVEAEEKYRNKIAFQRTFQIFMVTNHKPDFRSQGVALWDRVKLIEFTRYFSEAEQDRTLMPTLRSRGNREGILAWLVEGARRFYANNKQLPESTVLARATPE